MKSRAFYTTKLQAGLGLVSETKALFDLWQPGMSTKQLFDEALASGIFPNVTARRLRNIVSECFAPRYLSRRSPHPAQHLKRLMTTASNGELAQLMLLFTARANTILADFIREVYWTRYAGGYNEVSTSDARAFVERAVDDGKTVKRWSESTIRRVSAYLTGCCADYGLLQDGRKSSRQILPLRLTSLVCTFVAYDLHFRGVSDNSLIRHEDWGLFGLDYKDVLDELKRLNLKGFVLVQSAGDATRIDWKFKSMEELCDVIAES